MGQILNKGPRVRVSVWAAGPGPPGPEYVVLVPVTPRVHPETGEFEIKVPEFRSLFGVKDLVGPVPNMWFWSKYPPEITPKSAFERGSLAPPRSQSLGLFSG